MANFKHQYYFPEKKELLCMRCGVPIATKAMKKGEFMARYNERKIEVTDKNGGKGNTVLILGPECIDLDLTDQEVLDAKEQIGNAFESLRGRNGVRGKDIDSAKQFFSESTIKDLKIKNVIKETPEA